MLLRVTAVQVVETVVQERWEKAEVRQQLRSVSSNSMEMVKDRLLLNTTLPGLVSTDYPMGRVAA